MTLDADALVDRRRLRRRVTFWRVVAVGLAAAAVIAGAVLIRSPGMLSVGARHVARITIDGVITGDRATLRLIENVGKAESVAAVLVTIDSPGGTVTGSEALHDSLRRLSAQKPTVAVVNGLAASGGYIAALGTDRIIARQTSLVGSIGVIFQYPNLTKLLDSVGVQVESIKSTPLKAAPSGLEPTTEEARQAVRDLVLENYRWFRNLVKTRRGLDEAQLASVSDGRVFTGTQGVALKLVDEIGSEREAVAWLETQRDVTKGLPVRDWRNQSGLSDFDLRSGTASLLRLAGLDGIARVIDRAVRQAEGLTLDGLLAVWQPSGEK